MQIQKSVGIIGGLGRMASPLARHWSGYGPIRVIRSHDRGVVDDRRNRCREAWRLHGASLVPMISDVIGHGDLAGVFVCCGKNGDDLEIIVECVRSIRKQCNSRPPFICHLSTVSVPFVKAAHSFCGNAGITYVNYPLTGGPLGAENGKLLILTSGDPSLSSELSALLAPFGATRDFGTRVEAAAEVKFIGHLMVFNGLLGICSAAALHSEAFQNGQIGGQGQGAFFDFINQGAGGTRQWEVILSAGIKNDVWNAPFLLEYGAVDAIYAADLCAAYKVSKITVRAVLTVALSFSYVINKIDARLATHSIVREMGALRSAEFDTFIDSHLGNLADSRESILKCIDTLPTSLRNKVLLDVAEADFERHLSAQ